MNEIHGIRYSLQKIVLLSNIAFAPFTSLYAPLDWHIGADCFCVFPVGWMLK